MIEDKFSTQADKLDLLKKLGLEDCRYIYYDGNAVYCSITLKNLADSPCHRCDDEDYSFSKLNQMCYEEE